MGKMKNEKKREFFWLEITHLKDDIANEEWTEDPANLFFFLKKACDYVQITSDLSTPASEYKYNGSLYYKIQNAVNDKSTWAPDQERPCLLSPSSSPSINS